METVYCVIVVLILVPVGAKLLALAWGELIRW